VIRIFVAASQEYVNIYLTRRHTTGVVALDTVRVKGALQPQISAMGKFALRRHLSEFRLRAWMFCSI